MPSFWWENWVNCNLTLCQFAIEKAKTNLRLPSYSRKREITWSSRSLRECSSCYFRFELNYFQVCRHIYISIIRHYYYALKTLRNLRCLVCLLTEDRNIAFGVEPNKEKVEQFEHYLNLVPGNSDTFRSAVPFHSLYKIYSVISGLSFSLIIIINFFTKW